MDATDSFISIFDNLTDPRIDRQKRHKLIDILVITLCATICGADSWLLIEEFGKARKDWLGEFLELPNGIPSHDTFSRVFSLLDPGEFFSCFTPWVSTVIPNLSGDIVAIDGKSLRTASKVSDTPLHMITAFAVNNGIVLGQMKSIGKKNEIETLPLLLEKLMLKGCIVTLDAMGCQKKVVKQITSQEADYVISLKGNQGQLHSDVKLYMDSIIDNKLSNAKYDYYESTEKHHGRFEVRKYYITDSISWIDNKEKWSGLNSIGCVESTRIINDNTTVERRYYISSILTDAEKFGSAVRQHWGVENNVHWTMDVIFNEDKTLLHSGNSAENMASIRRLALNLLKKHSARKTIKAKKMLAALNVSYLEEIIFS